MVLIKNSLLFSFNSFLAFIYYFTLSYIIISRQNPMTIHDYYYHFFCLFYYFWKNRNLPFTDHIHLQIATFPEYMLFGMQMVLCNDVVLI